MPMIDVYAPAGLLPAGTLDGLRKDLVAALLDAEGVPASSPYLENTGVFVHELPAGAFGTGAEARARALRLVVTTPPSALTRAGQKAFVERATTLLATAAGDPALAARTWVTLTEAAEGGWGVSGVALGEREFAALRAGR